MREYRFHVMHADNSVRETRVHHFSDDETALEYGRQLVDGHAVEGWHGARLLFRLKPDMRD